MYETTSKTLYQNLSRRELQDAVKQKAVVLVPIGAIEQHGPQCPLDVGPAQSDAV